MITEECCKSLNMQRYISSD